MNDWRDVWKRLKNGHHVVLLRAGPIARPNPGELRLVVVDCEAFGEPRGALDEARRRIELTLGVAHHPIVDAATSRLRAGLRRHLLGEAPGSVDIARYREAFNRTPAAGAPRLALLLRSVDRADAASLELLLGLIGGEGIPKLPLLLSFDNAEPAGPARELLQHLQRILPADAFWAEATSGAAHVPGSNAGDAAASPRPLGNLPAPALRVLRAAATVGNRFESEVLAELLQLDELQVLGALQEAVDHGLTIEDRGQGLFRLEPALGEALRAGTLPSLATGWHERLAQLFGGPPAPGYATAARAAADAERQRAARAPAAAPPRSNGKPEDGSERPAPPVSPAAAGGSAVTPDGTSSGGVSPRPVPGAAAMVANDWFEVTEPPRSESVDTRREAWWQQLEGDLAARSAAELAQGSFGHASAPASVGGTRPGGGANGVSEQRAANHAEAAGLWDTACEQHLAAAERASLAGSHARALVFAARALALAEQLEDPERRRRVQVVALLLTGRSRWQSQGPDAEFSLQAALEPLLTCRTLMVDTDPTELRAELGSLIANVQYDIGTPQALEQALSELTLASQLLLEAGRPLEAARLLNDEAAVWVKLGDPVRANYLLSRSREVFSRVAGTYPAARLELAETEHLLARLLLQAAARPGRERDALQLGIEHGRAAEEAYRDLKERQKLGRVWETLGRLELRLGHLEQAASLLEEARKLQEELGDGVGLARSSAGLSEVLVATRDYARALERLAESVALNFEKGMSVGLEFNWDSLQQLEPQLPPELRDQARGLAQRLRQALDKAAPSGQRPTTESQPREG
jgi:tetratricopeptide (TPR) repeat protein